MTKQESISNLNYKHIIWDWNGTLLDDVWLCVDVMNQLLSTYKLPPISVGKYREVFDFPVKSYYEKIGFDFSIIPFEIVGTEFIKQYNQRHFECQLHSKATEVLFKLKQHGMSFSLLSAREEIDLLNELASRNINHLFEKVSGLNNHYADGKTENGKILISQLGLKHHEVVFIGDTIHDAEVAQSIGADCILIANGHQTKERLLSTGLTVLDSLDQLISII